MQLFATLWTVAHQAPPSMGFSWQEYWSGLPFLLQKKKKKNSILQKKKYQENKKELLEIANRQLKLKSQENC